MFLGLRTVIYRAPDLAQLKSWYAAILGFGPYFDEPFYVGFNVGGYELGLDPNAGGPGAQGGAGGATAYWGVQDIERAVSRATSLGARLLSAVQDVGDGIRVATVADPAGNVVGLIQNPHFKLPDMPAGA